MTAVNPRPRVLITTPSFGARSDAPWTALKDAGLEPVVRTDRHPLPAAELAALMPGVDAAIVGLDEVTAEVLDAADGLRVLAKHGVGVDNLDVAAAAARGVTVVNTPGANTGAVADLAFALLLSLARRIPQAHASTAAGRWERFFGPELAGRTLAVVGFGRIGRAVARRASGFDMEVVAHDPFLPGTEADGVPLLGLTECLARADAVTLHLPGGSGTPLIGAPELAAMRPGSYLVNTARGDLVDEAALAAALHDGHLAGAGVDAFAVEPPAGSPLLTAPNVVLTPHVGAASDDANAAMGSMVVADITRVLRGERPAHPVG
ncbi:MULTISPECIES: phosphoglycerate dehydrogenase [unclassified Pseudonocardia]|uniref:phosphoglycerate dehydrogenase n=1 Tax=unclassified Pseudonocardia TaxID=2619320 RepID=UPI00052587C4|nr:MULTISPECIES: phosphoglycerate dehydrogenase [unclassified Pseudonocardia]